MYVTVLASIIASYYALINNPELYLGDGESTGTAASYYRKTSLNLRSFIQFTLRNSTEKTLSVFGSVIVIQTKKFVAC